MSPSLLPNITSDQIAHRSSATLLAMKIGFVAAAIIQLIAYRSVEPVLVAIGFMLIGHVIFRDSASWGGGGERTTFMAVFIAGFFWAGITANFPNIFNNHIAISSDAAWFYKLSTDTLKEFNFAEMRSITTGAVHIYAWQLLYMCLAAVGFQQGVYVGTAFNAFLVAVAGVIGMKTAAVIFLDDVRIKHRITVIVALCAMFWLFSSVMLRDSSILLLNSLLIYFWVRFLVQKDWTSFVKTIALGGIAQVLYLNLRAELMFVPAALALAALFSLIILNKILPKSGIFNKNVVAKILVCLLSSILVQVMVYAESGFHLIDAARSSSAQYTINATAASTNSSSFNATAASTNSSSFNATAASTNSSSSLGIKYIINQPLLIRAAIGSYYVNVFPVPFWNGFVSGEIYQIFKSINAIYMWFVIPLAMLGLYEAVSYYPIRQKLGSIFLAVVYLGFTVGVGATSLETRHLASFYMPLLILAAIPNFNFQPTIDRFFKVFGVWAILIVLLHLAWYSLKQMQLGLS